MVFLICGNRSPTTFSRSRDFPAVKSTVLFKFVSVGCCLGLSNDRVGVEGEAMDVVTVIVEFVPSSRELN